MKKELKNGYKKISFTWYCPELKERFYSITLYDNDVLVWHTSFGKKDLSVNEILEIIKIEEECTNDTTK